MGVIGRVTAGGEARVPLPVHSGGGVVREVDALVDTGFNGEIALPSPLVKALGLTLIGRERMVLADGTSRFARTYRAFVELNEQRYAVRVVEAGEPLVGMGLLWGHDLRIQCVSAGNVVLEPRSTDG
jgi:clan AA aspartic protease